MAETNILFLQNQLCGRSWRSAKVLADRGVPLTLLDMGPRHPGLDYSVFQKRISVGVGKDIRSMVLARRRIISALKHHVRREGIQLVHSNNAPDNLGVWAIRNLDVPVVHDVHDLQSTIPIGFGNPVLRPLIRTFYNRWEAVACRTADAVIVTSPRMRDRVSKMYSPQRLAVVENKAPPQEYETLPKKSAQDGNVHVVYAGSMTTLPGTHRSFLPVMQSLAQGRIHFHIYPVTFSDDERDKIRKICDGHANLHFHEPVLTTRLIRELTQYDFGWVHFPAMTDNVRLTSTTKLYEYVLAGIPVVANPEGRIAEFVREHGCGIVVERPDEAIEPMLAGGEYSMPVDECTLDPAQLLDLYDDLLTAR